MSIPAIIWWLAGLWLVLETIDTVLGIVVWWKERRLKRQRVQQQIMAQLQQKIEQATVQQRAMQEERSPSQSAE